MPINKRLSIMQPYIFPYLGYFHLIESSEKIIFYDDVNYIKKGWINKNRILMNGAEFQFTIPVEKVSQNKLILEIVPAVDDVFKNKFFAQLDSCYKKAPNYLPVKNLIENVFSLEYNSISEMAIASITSVYTYIGKDLSWAKSSEISPSTKGIEKADRLIQICKEQGYDSYINAMGGMELYSKSYFKKQDIELSFVEPQLKEYPQFKNNFVPWLSIIDVLMFNSPEEVIVLLGSYAII